MRNIFFIPMNSSSLAHYFSKAIILPAKYFSNRMEDIQNKFSDSVLLSKNKWTKGTDCSIEVILTDSELKTLIKKSGNYFELNIPLPISRVKSVWFLSSEQKETTIWNINKGAAFVPEYIIQVEQSKNIEFDSGEDIIPSKQLSSSNDIAEKANRFDILLGGFAFMKLGGKSFMNFSENYFSTLSYFNKLIEEQLAKTSSDKGLKFSNKYHGLFSKNDSEWSKWQHYIYQQVDANDIENIAINEGIKIQKKYGLISLDLISPQSHIFEIAILATYGERKSKSTDNLVTDLINGVIASEKAEDISLVFGLHNGYSKLRNKYNERSVKFRLESKLDYYTIESIYQFAFNGNKNNYSFPYIDEWCITANQKEPIKGYDTYTILDTIVVTKKKQTSLEKFFQDYSTEIYSSIYKSVKDWLPPFAKYDEKAAISFFEMSIKSSLTNAIVLLQKEIERGFQLIFDSEISALTKKFEIDKKRIEAEVMKLEAEIFELRNPKRELKINIVRPDLHTKNTSASQISETENIFPDNYDSMTLTELKKLAEQLGIKKIDLKKYSKKDSESLIELLRQTTPTLHQ